MNLRLLEGDVCKRISAIKLMIIFSGNQKIRQERDIMQLKRIELEELRLYRENSWKTSTVKRAFKMIF